MNRHPNPPRSNSRRKRAQSGYILLLLMLAIAIMAIMMTAAASRMAHQVKRDRETEMIHRGEQYERAVKKYVAKMKTYPTSIEQLEKTNNIRFLRKRYTDPMTPEGKWKLVRLTDVQLAGGNTGTGLGASSGSGTGGGIFGGGTGGGTGGGGTSGTTGGTTTGGTTGSGTTGGGTGSSGLFSNSLSGQTFGGGPIAGVASMSEQNGIREFNNKKKYNQWLFVYVLQADPCQMQASQTSNGCILKGPFNPQAGNLGPSKVGTPAGDLNKPPQGTGGEQPPPSGDLGPK